MENKDFFIVFILVLFLLCPNIYFLKADQYSSANFVLQDPVITIEGGSSSSANFGYISSSGQVITGENTSGSFIQRAGFLYFPAAVSGSITPTPTPTSTPNPGGGGGGGGGGGYTTPITPEMKNKALGACDFNHDGKCDIADFSILLYYFNQSGSQIAPYDLNQDGKVDLIDLSILFYYWTL